MNHRRRKVRNPDTLVSLAWAAGSAAVAGTVGYLILREYFTNRVLAQCAQSLRQANPAASVAEHRSKIRSLL